MTDAFYITFVRRKNEKKVTPFVGKILQCNFLFCFLSVRDSFTGLDRSIGIDVFDDSYPFSGS